MKSYAVESYLFVGVNVFMDYISFACLMGRNLVVNWLLKYNVLMFVSSFSSELRIFHSFGDVTIAGERLQILTYARHSWPLSSEGSLTCHIYYDTGHPFMMVISEDPWHSHLGLSQLRFEHQAFRLRANAKHNARQN